jgi:magnesium chelatase family protein
VIAAVLVRAHGFAIDRGAAGHVDVELDVRAGLPGLALVGLAGGSGRDVRERVQAAVLNSGFSFPRRRLTVNLAPATRRGGSEVDLVVACCLLAASGVIDPRRLGGIGLCAELGLGGGLRACAALPAAAEAADAAGLGGLIVARADLPAARAGAAVAVVGLRTLCEVVDLLGAPGRELRRMLRAPEHGRGHAIAHPST